MTKPKQTLFGPEDSDQQVLDEFDKLVLAFQEHVDAFAVERDLTFGVVSLLAAQVAMTMRMFDYAASADEPSAAGLKLELDRYRGEIDNAVSSAKNGAGEFLAIAGEAFAQAEADERPK